MTECANRGDIDNARWGLYLYVAEVTVSQSVAMVQS
jgi:hypothetical protein